eukprot:gnl/TRDRNA2_/TRDRNA2_194033_c0_seq1.p1 gnl/TRDRNA2_/TRDRNA2_194033_c0~~gnl/TRDRNA2_/TRDRNA2_194033_c0_seq1.p1  ORF type:complete len:370 (+),score=64.67 gnl/TRDRNA2_/TRDRNA2_194033_c0_seq1:75-1184(+)
MKVLITGGGGFIGLELCKSLLRSQSLCTGTVTEIVLFDVPGAFDRLANQAPCNDPKVRCETGSIDDAQTIEKLVDQPGMSVFHLAAVVSGTGEKDFDLCLRVNMDGTRNVLEASRRHSSSSSRVRVVSASSIATYGEIPEDLSAPNDFTKQVPLNTYGMTKTIGELLVNDYTRKGFVDGRSARLPTVVVRPGAPNGASTGCFSGVIREPLKGIDVELPVDTSLPHTVTSSRMVVENLRRLHDADFSKIARSDGALPVDRGVLLPSTTATLQGLTDALFRVVPKGQHAKLGKITEKIDPFLSKVVGGMAAKALEHSRALKLGLCEVPDLDTIVRQYMEDFADDCVATCSEVDVAAQEPPAKRQRTVAEPL